jgi:hypothetical protein
MSESTLMLHCGGRLVTEDELGTFKVPESTRSWVPVAHTKVLANVKEALVGAGYEIAKQSLGVAKDGARFFGTLDLTTKLRGDGGVCLAVGIRNSVDKTFPLGFAAGNRVFVCDNLSFSADLNIRKRHTVNGATLYQNAIAVAVQSLATFQEAERARIDRLMNLVLTDDQALAMMVRAVETDVIAAPTIPKLLAEWRQPKHDYGTGDAPTGWRLLNAFTTVLGHRARTNPSEYTRQTIKLNAMLAV